MRSITPLLIKCLKTSAPGRLKRFNEKIQTAEAQEVLKRGGSRHLNDPHGIAVVKSDMNAKVQSRFLARIDDHIVKGKPMTNEQFAKVLACRPKKDSLLEVRKFTSELANNPHDQTLLKKIQMAEVEYSRCMADPERVGGGVSLVREEQREPDPKGHQLLHIIFQNNR